MKMLKYCQNLLEDEVVKSHDLRKCRLYVVRYQKPFWMFIEILKSIEIDLIHFEILQI